MIAQRQTPENWGVSSEYFTSTSNTNDNNKQTNRRTDEYDMQVCSEIRMEEKFKSSKRTISNPEISIGKPLFKSIKIKLNLSIELFACNNSRKQRRSIIFLCLSLLFSFSLLALVPRANWFCSKNSLVGFPSLGLQPQTS